MQNDLDQILIDPGRIAQRVAEVAREIASPALSPQDRPSRGLTIIPVLTGSVVFLADLIRHLPIYLRLEMVSVSSYPGVHTTPGKLRILTDLDTLDLAGRDVLLVDDILDSGQTLCQLAKRILPRQPASLRTCVLLRKNRDTPPAITVDHACFDVPDVFVVGYGLDYNGYYRNLPCIATLRPEAISRHAQ